MITSQFYTLPDQETKVIFSQNILNYMFSFVQNKNFIPESGGQIFSKNPDDITILIDAITGPYSTDQRSRYAWNPDVKKMSHDRVLLFDKGLYVVGLWHTHPELNPKSSRKDRITSEKHLKLLDPAYKGFLLVTMGNGSQYPELSIEYLERKNFKWHKL